MSFSIRPMLQSDAEPLFHAFAGRDKTREQYDLYWRENKGGERLTLVAIQDGGQGHIVGYNNVLWRSNYEPFRARNIPEINDLNVADQFQGRGIGTALIRRAEEAARERGYDEIGIGFGLAPNDVPAQRLYSRLGYVPDGRGTHPSPWGDVLYSTLRLS